MTRQRKIFFIFSIILLMIIGIKFTKEYNENLLLKEQIAKEETKSLATLMMAFRKTYQESFMKNHINIDDKTINLLPVKTTKEISDKFSEAIGGNTIIRTISDNPRNPINMANAKELTLIEYFKKNPTKKNYFERDKNTVYYAQPLFINQKCLKCHGKKENAPQIIQDRYKDAYDYKVGDLRGIISIKTTKNDIINILDNGFNRNLLTAIIVYFSALFAIQLLIRLITSKEEKYTHELEEKLEKQKEELKESERILIEQSRNAAMGEMISNIAHQWRQPLTAVASRASLMELDHKFGKDENIPANAKIIKELTKNMSQTIDDFRDFFKPNKEKELFCIKDTINTNIGFIKYAFEQKGIQLTTNLISGKMLGFKNELSQALLNILNNAKDVLVEKINDENLRFVFINMQTTTIKYNNKDIPAMQITIKDSGGGIPNEEIRQKIFDPYFTTKHQSNGTGIGLHMTKQIINNMNGTIRVDNVEYVHENQKYNGAEFTIILPQEIE